MFPLATARANCRAASVLCLFSLFFGASGGGRGVDKHSEFRLKNEGAKEFTDLITAVRSFAPSFYGRRCPRAGARSAFTHFDEITLIFRCKNTLIYV